MKLFNIENDREIIYVQRGDLILLQILSEEIPEEVSNYISRYPLERNNPLQFIPFFKEETITYFQNAKWLIDYRSALLLTNDELMEIGQTLAKEANEISVEYHSLGEGDRKRHSLEREYILKKHKMHDFANVYKVKKGLTVLPIPAKKDSFNDTFKGFENKTYFLAMSLNPNKFLLFRKDQKPFQKNEVVPMSLVNFGSSIIAMKMRDNGIEFDQYKSRYCMSSDHTCLITEVSIVPKKKKANRFKQFFIKK